MGFGRIIGYIFSIIWILSSLLFLPYSLIWIWAPFVIIIVLRRQAKREVRLEEYAKSQAESLQKISNQSRSPIINVNANEILDNEKQKELDSKETEFWVYDKYGKPLMKIHKEDKEKYPELTNTDKGNSNNKESENKSLGEIKNMKDGTIWNAVQISEDSVKLMGLNDSFFMSLQHFKDALYEDRFRRIDE